MDRMLYVAMSNARQMMHAQTVVTHNLANANTVGFKADLESVRAMPVFGPGLPSRAYAMVERSGVDLDGGSIEQTGNPLDLAIDGDGWFAVIAPDGTEAYTRDGDLRVSVNGLLTTSTGLPLIGNSGPISVPENEQLVVGTDGTISVRPLGQNANALAIVDRIRLVKPQLEQVQKSGDGLFRMRDGGIAPPDASVKVVQGAVEASNVSAIDQLVKLMGYQRQYEIAVKAMNTASEVEASGTQMMRMS